MPSLTQDDAVARSAALDVHSYVIDLDLASAVEGTTFISTVTIVFDARDPGLGTFIEVAPVELLEATLNGAALDPAALAENRLPLTDLHPSNTLVVRARMAYSNSGEGLHRFTDPEDGAVYLYAQSFLDQAQRLFACFDQPDLKATFQLSVTAPPEWEVAANAPGSLVGPGRWEFEPTPPLATYMVSLIAGPYHVRRASHDGIPLALYCRRGLAPYLDAAAEEIFDVTRACLDYYHALFGVRYAFGKYDHAFVPEFNAGAMENPGLVTARDEFVFRSAVTEAERELRAMLIAHEMAHMWFGDLVTMRWWDDLWLSESFAEYMAYRTVRDATRFSQAWTSFVIARKGWGYADDQRPSTHPVAPASLPDAGLALLNFDGISYAKGASVLRQLAAWIGDEAFVAGLRAYFGAHAFGNATLADLLDALTVASGRDLHGWADVWLRVPEVNTLRPEVEIGPDGRFVEVTIVQTAPDRYPTLRPHRLGLGVYKGGSLLHRVEADLDPAVDHGRTLVPALTGQSAGDLLLPNDGDLTYAKIRFDPASQAALLDTLPRLDDSLARALIWASVTDAVRDAQMPAGDLVGLCAAALPSETSQAVFRDVVMFVTATVIDQYLPEGEQPAARATLAAANKAVMNAAEPGSGHQLAAARGFLASAGPSDVDELRGWLDGSAAPPGLVIDAEIRWIVLTRLCALGAATADDIDAEYERDHTAAGAEYAARCRAARPDAGAKADAWRVIMTDDQLSNRLVLAAAEGFWQPHQAEVTEPYVSRFFAEVPAMAARRDQMLVLQVVPAAYPRYAVSPSTLESAERLLATPGVPATLHRSVVDATDDLRRALAARALVVGAHAH
jgi:aminopeptidase N